MKTSKHLCVLALTFFYCVGLWAQSVANSRVTGVVTDATGASVGGAQVQMTQTDTGLVRTATTNDDGSYTIPDLPTGPYQLQVKKQGFNSYAQSGIVLEVGSNPTLNVALQVGAVTQEVTVTANAAIVETHSSQLGQVVNQQEVLDIPLNARDPMQLLTLTPSAVVSSVGFNNSQLVFPSPYTVAFSGTSPGAGTYILDGGNDNDQTTAGVFPLPFPDALQEFNVTTSAVPAQYGMHSSATINAITKSGTNVFHGDAFEFVRNGLFNARSYYAGFRDPLKRNQFGGVIGGPIKKDKLFFFAAVQDTIVRDQATYSAVLPTAAELAGNFEVAASPQCTGKANTIALPAPFVGNMVSPTQYSTPAVNLAKLLPVSTTDPACGTYSYQAKVATDDQSIVGKVDYHINDKNSLFVRYYYANFNLPPDPTNFLTEGQADQHDGYQTVTMGETYLISSSIVNSAHGNVNRANNRKGYDPGVATPTQLGVGGDFYSPYPNFATITITNDFSAKSAGIVPVYFNPTDFQFTDDVEWTRGSHQLAFGGELAHYNTNSITNVYVNGSFTFSGQTTGLPMADFFLGDVSAFTQENQTTQNNRKNYYALYAQDSWQVNRKLTLNYGLRWEPFVPPATLLRNTNAGEGTFFSLPRFIAGMHSTVFPNAPAGLEYPGDYPGHGNSYLADWTHFEPRIGVSYDPSGKGREVIRASYGIFYDFEGFQMEQVMRQAPPFSDALTLNGVNFTNPYATFTSSAGVTGVDPFPLPQGAGYVFQPGGAFATYSELHLKAPMLQQWNLSVQKQFAQSWSITASYIGNHGTHNWIDGDEDPAEYVAPGECGLSNPAAACSTSTTNTVTGTQARRRLMLLNPSQGKFFATILDFQDDGSSSYDGGILTVQKRLSNDFSMVANYTYGHCIDNGEPIESGTAPVWRNDLSREVSNCSWDNHTQVTITGLIRSPQFHSGLVEAIAGHWQVAPIITYLSGDWLTVSTGADTALVGISGGQRPNLVGNPALVHTRAVFGTGFGVRWFNPNAYAPATVTAGFTGNVINNGSGPITVGPLGDLGRNTFQGPSNRGFDLALTREFKINERNEIDARIEAFNILNLVRYYDPTVVETSSSFGESIAPASGSTPGYSSPQDPRIMQFALKYIF